MQPILQMLHDVNIVAILCKQWGDTGKGKFVDLLAAEWADIIARGNGGANAGHTICRNGRQFITHMVPSGILHDADGKINVIGRGVALDPRALCEELEMLSQAGFSYDHLYVSHQAHLVLPQHLLLDRVREGNLGEARIGTTGRGQGPVFSDHVARSGLIVNDLLNPDLLVKKIKANLVDKVRLLSHPDYDPEVIKEVLQHSHLGNGDFYNSKSILDLDAIVEAYLGYGKRIKDLIRDTEQLIQNSVLTKNILLEGAQGILLDVDYGTYPYVTASGSCLDSLARGVGLKSEQVGLTLGMVKAFYITRVGEGPFPTEIGGDASAKWCGQPEMTKERELRCYRGADINSPDPFLQGVAIRIRGDEYGATTRRPRRVGWSDSLMTRYSHWPTTTQVVLTKVDVLSEMDEINICSEYTYEGPPYRYAQHEYRIGTRLRHAVPDSFVLKHCEPQYHRYPGWLQPISGTRDYADLPLNLRRLIQNYAVQAEMNVRMISVGPRPEETIVVPDGYTKAV